MELFDMHISKFSAGTVVAGVFAAVLAGPVSSQVDEGPIGPSPYNIIEGWHVPFAKQGFAFGGNSGVWAESPDRIIVAQRGETRLPIPIPSEFAGYAGSIGINTLSATDLRTWQNCLYTLDRNGNVTEIWEQWDYLCAGSEGPNRHPHSRYPDQCLADRRGFGPRVARSGTRRESARPCEGRRS